jgi:hypothetical protein
MGTLAARMKDARMPDTVKKRSQHANGFDGGAVWRSGCVVGDDRSGATGRDG